MNERPRPRPRLSIVVGSHNARASIGLCLESLERQENGNETEIIVVDNSTDGTAEVVAKDFSHLQLVRSPEFRFIPELWEQGIRRSSGEIVAITTAHCVPEDRWVQGILRAHNEGSYAGIAGAIEIEGHANLVDWAIYFCRYSPYMRPFSAHVVKDIPGDNASYRRWALERCTDVRTKGFWEPEINQELRKDGFELLLTPTFAVFHGKSFSFFGFMYNRFWHGRQFGMDRASKLSLMGRVVYILLSPMIPLVFLFRITRNVFTKGRHVDKLLVSFPILTLFLLSWSLGELSGYILVSRQ
jgi:glycosyltransferase involved in cell wall biosynthesis